MIYPWQAQTWTKLLSLRERLPHALLIHGPRGIGKRDLAMAFAQLLLCDTPASQAPCGNCQSCRWFGQDAHPDFVVLDPYIEEASTEDGEGTTEKGKKSQQIKVEAIRQLGDFVTLSAHGGGWKVALLHPAESMNPAAANALLKTLEEPPANVLLILVCHQIQKLLPTIRSRCMKMPLAVPGRAESLAWLSQQGVRQSESALALAAGAPLEARHLGEAPSSREARSLFLDALSADLPPTAAAERLLGVETPELVRWLQMWIYDLVAEQSGIAIRYHPENHSLLRRLGKDASPERLLALHRGLNEAQRFAAHPLNKQLLLEKLMLAYNHAIQPRR